MRRLKCLIMLLVCLPAYSQSRFVSQDWDFVHYLLGNDLEQDAAVLMRCSQYMPSDTLDYLKGWTCYSIKDLENAAVNFQKVPEQSVFFDKSAFFGSISCAHNGDYSGADSFIDKWALACPSAPKLLQDCYLLEKSGLALLQDKPEEYLKWSSEYSGSEQIRDNFDILGRIYNDTYCKPEKKAWKAGLASAIIPGAGQWYASDKVSGALTFLLEGAMAAIIVEQWKHYGPSDWRTMVWTGLGACIHIANIYEATVSVSVRNDFVSQERSTAVLYNIHIPLRSVFR